MKQIKSTLTIVTIGLSMLLACSTPGPVTGRPDPNVMTSGTLGSARSTERPANIPVPKADTVKKDTVH